MKLIFALFIISSYVYGLLASTNIICPICCCNCVRPPNCVPPKIPFKCLIVCPVEPTKTTTTKISPVPTKPGCTKTTKSTTTTTTTPKPTTTKKPIYGYY